MTEQEPLKSAKPNMPVILGLSWVVVVVFSHIYFNISYYAYKVATFGSFILRFFS